MGEMNKKGNFWEGLFVFILIVGLLFELTLVLIAWHYADRVKCNLIWCEFTFKDEIGNNTLDSWSITNITENSVCYLNNAQVNCSDYIKWEPYNGTE